ncbi:MAG: O-antigen ligase family protein [Burkholderiaceae bacterium]
MIQDLFTAGSRCSFAAIALIIVAPTLSLFVPGFGSSLLYLLMILCVISFASSGRRNALSVAPGYWRVLAVGASCLLAGILVAQWAHGQWHASSVEKAIRILCVLPLVYFFGKISAQRLRHVQWGFMLGALSGAWALIMPKVVFPAADGTARPDTASFTLYNTVGFANLVMLFSTLTLASLGWQVTRFTRSERILKIGIALIGYWGVLVSQTRTSLLAIPVFLVIAFLAHSRTSWRGKAMLAAATIAALAILASTNVFKERVQLAVSETEQCASQPNTESSVCIRFQLLRAAGAMFKEHPMVGAGDGQRFGKKMQDLADQGVISDFVAKNWGETHNDLSYMAATYGLIGLVPFLLVIYGIPTWYFVRHLRLRDYVCVTASTMGLILVLGFLAFGLTEMMFRSMRTVSFYVVLLALFLALSAPSSSSARVKS